jgi:hypothetical protein
LPAVQGLRDGILIAGGWLVVILAAVATQLVTMALAQHAPALISTLTGGLFGS